MKMLTKALAGRLPALYSTENIPTDEKVAVFKYFCPWNQWTWYVVEGEPEVNGDSENEQYDYRFFGWVQGFEDEWGYFMLSELESVTGPLGLKIERDLYFEPTKMKDIPNYK